MSKNEPFIEFLEQSHEDRAMLAALRRGLGRKPGEAPSMFPYVVKFLPQNPHQNYEVNVYRIASLFALHPVSISSGNMGTHLHKLAGVQVDDAATERRFIQLLNQRIEAIDIPLRQHITLLKANDIAVNWHQLFYDLNYWDHDDHFVQRQWADAFWRTQQISKSTDT
jgi:CRISPR system Cascade subunit CasB